MDLPIRHDHKYGAMSLTRAAAAQLGHELTLFDSHHEGEYRAECMLCKAEVFVSRSHDDLWKRYPGWEIQHQCTGEV